MRDVRVERMAVQAQRSLLPVVLAMAASVLLLAGAAWLLVARKLVALPDLPPAVIWILAALGVATLLAGQLVTRTIGARLRSAATPEAALAAFRARHLVAFALRENAAVLGFVATLLTGDLRWCWG